MNWHKFASIALGIGSFAAAHFIPASLLIPLGPVAVPVGAAVAGVLAIAAAVGIEPTQVSPTVANLIGSITVGKLGQTAPATTAPKAAS